MTVQFFDENVVLLYTASVSKIDLDRLKLKFIKYRILILLFNSKLAVYLLNDFVIVYCNPY